MNRNPLTAGRPVPKLRARMIPPEIEALLVLQDRDQKIRALRLEQKNLPRDLKAVDDKLAAAKTRLEGVHQRARTNEVERRRLEGEVGVKQTAIGRFKTQQQATRKNEEFQALTKEIAHAEEQIRVLEDRELELMEAAETLLREVKAEEAEFVKTEAQLAKQAADLRARGAGLGERLAALEGERGGLTGKVGAGTLNLYDRLFVKKGDAAVVALEHEVCSGCHMKAPAQIVAHVRAGQALAQCPNCGRILYRDV